MSAMNIDSVGIATSFAMLKGWGFRGRPVGLAVAVTGVWNQLLILGVPIVALAGLPDVTIGVMGGAGGNATLRGKWTLVKIKRGKEEWLLIKERDAQVSKDGDDFLAIDWSKEA